MTCALAVRVLVRCVLSLHSQRRPSGFHPHKQPSRNAAQSGTGGDPNDWLGRVCLRLTSPYRQESLTAAPRPARSDAARAARQHRVVRGEPPRTKVWGCLAWQWWGAPVSLRLQQRSSFDRQDWVCWGLHGLGFSSPMLVSVMKGCAGFCVCLWLLVHLDSDAAWMPRPPSRPLLPEQCTCRGKGHTILGQQSWAIWIM